MYDLNVSSFGKIPERPVFGSILERAGSDVTVVATSIMVVEAKRAARFLEDHGISIEIIDLHSISHPNYEMIIESVSRTGKLVIADTSWSAFGVAAEINRIVNEHQPGILTAPSISLGMQPAPCPTAKALEDYFYPDVSDIVNACAKLVTGKRQHGIEIPERQSMTDFYKHFKGPF